MSVEIRRVGVVGCGTMGSGICEVVARSGFDVVFAEMSEEAVASGAGAHRAQRRPGGQARKDSNRLRPTTLLGRISSTTDLERPGRLRPRLRGGAREARAQEDVCGRSTRSLKAEAILATNTSSLPVIDMAVATNRPGSGGRVPLLQSGDRS